MAQYAFDPNDYAVGTLRGDLPFTVPEYFDIFEIKDDNNGLGHYLSLRKITTFAFEPLVFTFVPSSSDAEIFIDSTETLTSVNAARSHGVIRKISEDDFYYGGHTWGPSQFVIGKVDSGESTVLSQGGSGVDTPKRLGVRFQVDGANLKLKTWEMLDLSSLARDSEPELWSSEITDSTFSDAGSVGMMFPGVSGDRPYWRKVYFIGVGTNGDSAPVNPLVVVDLNATDLTVNSALLNWDSS